MGHLLREEVHIIVDFTYAKAQKERGTNVNGERRLFWSYDKALQKISCMFMRYSG